MGGWIRSHIIEHNCSLLETSHFFKFFYELQIFSSTRKKFILSERLHELFPIIFHLNLRNIWSEVQVFLPLKTTNPCKKTQYWIEKEDGTTKCIDCQTSPPGQTASPECGNSKPLPSNTLGHCVACQLGKSFSNEHSTSVCTPCSYSAPKIRWW